MSDGAVLLADRWAPVPGSGTAPGGPQLATPPIVLLRSPYGRRQLGPIGRIFAERGYQAVIQSCRGTFGSEGDFEPFRHERADGLDTLAWLATQSWFGGSVATFGPSYLGLVQWAVCEDAPDFLRAMSPAVTAADFRDAVIFPGNALAFESMLSWVYQVEHQERPPWRVLRSIVQARSRLRPGYASLPLADADRRVVGRRVGFFQDWLEHDAPGDKWWDPVDFRAGRAQAPPATFLGGWYDLFLPQQVEDFVAVRAAGRPARLTIGPWTHVSPGGMAASLRESLAWFDAHVGSGDSHQTPSPAPIDAVRLFVMGERRWATLADWPPPATLQRWHLHAGGRLDPGPPSESDADRFRYDPADPTPGIGGPSLDARNAGRKDQRRREDRADVLTYTSEPMVRSMTVAGPLAVDLHLRSSLDHTDVVVRLCVVSAKGRSTNLSDGVLRLRPGEVAPDEDGVLHLQVTMWPTAVTFRRGERLRLQVSSGAHPLFARNTGSGEPLASAATTRAADQEVFHDPRLPSAIELPVASI
jgi:putative CocE/NonD family hydrolase